MARIPLATRDSVPEKQRAVFDALVQQRGNVPNAGPLAIMIHVPELMQRGEDFRAYLRGDDSCLPLKIRELAMILTARGFGRSSIPAWGTTGPGPMRSYLAGLREDGQVNTVKSLAHLCHCRPIEHIQGPSRMRKDFYL